jgi:signal transduction histidine kinase
VTVSVLLAAGMAATWSIVMRRLRRQRARMTDYLRRIESANADLNAFAGRTAHDLRDVLSPLPVAVATIRHCSIHGEPLDATLQRIERVTGRAWGLVDALLTFSRAGRPSDSTEVCSVVEELRAALEELTPMVERTDAEIELVLEPIKDPHVRCPGALLGIVFRNVIGNAVKYLEGRTTRYVRVEVRTLGGRYCQIAIKDTGPGIPQESITRIFDPFYRVPGTRAPGTGIGLATVLRIVRAHGGEVFVRSALDQGSRFELQFPLANDARLAVRNEPHRRCLQADPRGSSVARADRKRNQQKH